jgi:hypothetical protein
LKHCSSYSCKKNHKNTAGHTILFAYINGGTVRVVYVSRGR